MENAYLEWNNRNHFVGCVFRLTE